MTADDPVLARRKRAARFAALGQRVGYGLFGLAVAAFVYGLTIDFGDGVSRLATACLILGSLVLAPAIVVGYAVKAAVRDDLEHGRDIGPG